MLELPLRPGPRPKTTPHAPHTQLDQTPPGDIYDLLKDRAFDFPEVERRPSIISVPGAEALWYVGGEENRCQEAFMIGNEFAHVHPPHDGSLHLMLPRDGVRELLDKGWGEMHPMALLGRIPPTAVMVFGPRDAQEVELVLGIVGVSHAFAAGSGA
jgi:hypothetical protein